MNSLERSGKLFYQNKPPSTINIKERNIKTNQRKPGYLKKKFVEFCRRTDFHGFKYVAMQDLTLLERCFWAVSILMSLIFASYFVITAYKWYARNPIITVIESTHGPIWEVPFPAVTICDLNLISREAARDFAEDVELPEHLTADEIYDYIRLSPVLLLSATEITEQEYAKLDALQQVIEINNMTAKDFFDMVAPARSCSDLIERCMWKNTVYRCELLFKQVFTQFSRCCIFNYYAIDEPSKNQVLNEVFEPPTPRRIASCGYQTGLTVLLNTDSADYYSALIASFGAVAFIDNAYNVPSLNSPIRLIGPATEVFVALSPESTYATRGIRAFPPEERQCYFSDEISLGKIKQYSAHNCMLYKMALSFKKYCDCIPFYVPFDDYRSCNFSDVKCISSMQLKNKEPDELNCLPDCEHYDYPMEAALGFLATDIPLAGLAFYRDVELQNRSLLNIFFNDLVTTKYRRDVYLNWQNLLASFGGLLSLMLGFTLVSAIDFLMFFTFRIGYDSVKQVTGSESKGNLANNRVFVEEGLHKKDRWVGQGKFGNLDKRY